jgi:hypothetical protein
MDWRSLNEEGILNNIPTPAIPKPSDKETGNCSNEARSPMYGMRVSIQDYSGNQVSQKPCSENSNIDNYRPIFPYRLGLNLFSCHITLPFAQI